jgi:hypothetical protein
MRQTFNMGDASALVRVRGAKKPGRKHNHTPRGRALQKRLETPKKRQALASARRRKLNARIAAYWRGEIETHPGATA